MTCICADQAQEFHSFVQQTESQLRTLFNEIDLNHDGKLDRQELSAACQRAGLAVSNAKLDRFFEKVDSNNDGSVSFREWASVPPAYPNFHPDYPYNITSYANGH